MMLKPTLGKNGMIFGNKRETMKNSVDEETNHCWSKGGLPFTNNQTYNYDEMCENLSSDEADEEI